MDTSTMSDTHLEHLKSITTLGSGKEIDKTVYTKATHIGAHKSSAVGSENLEPLISESKNVSREKEKEKVSCQMPTPFSQQLRVPKKGTTNVEIYKLFEQVKINIPLLDAIKQIPAYAKFLKDLCTVKRTMQLQKKALFMEKANSIIQTMIAPKYKNLGCLTIAIVIRATRIELALLDLGANVNLLPYSVYQQLSLGQLKPTNATLQLANKSTRIPRGMVEDVLI